MHIFFHHRPLLNHPYPISAYRLWMVLWASHKQLSQVRWWRAEDKENHRIKWISYCIESNLIKLKIQVSFVGIFLNYYVIRVFIFDMFTEIYDDWC